MICGILFPDYGPGPKDETGCTLECGHLGMHRFAAKDGHEYEWETDWKCDCEDCMSGDGNSCVIYGRCAPPVSAGKEQA